MKNRFSRILLAFTAAALAAVMLTVSAGAAEYEKIRSYTGQFTDVSESDWFYQNVAGAYELGLISGKSETTFDPEGSLTIAETIKLASVCHQLLTKGSLGDGSFSAEGAEHWYDPYVTYAVQRDIVTEAYEDYNAPATRGMVAVLFSRAVNASGVNTQEINSVDFGSIPDTDAAAWYATSVYRLARWGIMVGDEKGLAHPESSVRRSEISAVVTRVIDPSVRVLMNGSAAEAPAGEEKPAETPAAITNGVLTLYEGEVNDTPAEDKHALNGFAADFALADGTVSVNASYNLHSVHRIAVEKDSVSFRIYDANSEILTVLSNKLKTAAVGANGSKIREASEVYTEINDLFELWIDGERKTVGGLWYAEHEGYTAYAFYLEETVDLTAAKSYRLVCGDVEAEVLKQSGLDTVADLTGNAATVKTGDAVEMPAETNSEQYAAAIEAAKSTAVSIPFEYESDRCYILYGAGLYGTGAEDYRLLFIFRDGTSQTVANQKLTAIRVNAAGTVLYYTVSAPDGGSIQYGVNFDN